MRIEVDTKESLLRTEKAKVDQAQKDMFLKQRALESVHIQRLKEQAVPQVNVPLAASSMTSPKKAEEIATIRRQEEERMRKIAQMRKSMNKPITDSFKASDFIQELEKDFGKQQPKFMDYIVGEKNLLLKSKQDISDKVAQSAIFSHSHSQNRYQASDRKEKLISSLMAGGPANVNDEGPEQKKNE